MAYTLKRPINFRARSIITQVRTTARKKKAYPTRSGILRQMYTNRFAIPSLSIDDCSHHTYKNPNHNNPLRCGPPLSNPFSTLRTQNIVAISFGSTLIARLSLRASMLIQHTRTRRLCNTNIYRERTWIYVLARFHTRSNVGSFCCRSIQEVVRKVYITLYSRALLRRRSKMVRFAEPTIICVCCCWRWWCGTNCVQYRNNKRLYIHIWCSRCSVCFGGPAIGQTNGLTAMMMSEWRTLTIEMTRFKRRPIEHGTQFERMVDRSGAQMMAYVKKGWSMIWISANLLFMWIVENVMNDT